MGGGPSVRSTSTLLGGAPASSVQRRDTCLLWQKEHIKLRP